MTLVLIRNILCLTRQSRAGEAYSFVVIIRDNEAVIDAKKMSQLEILLLHLVLVCIREYDN